MYSTRLRLCDVILKRNAWWKVRSCDVTGVKGDGRLILQETNVIPG